MAKRKKKKKKLKLKKKTNELSLKDLKKIKVKKV